MNIGFRLLLLLSGFLVGTLTKEYLEGMTSIIFQSIVWTIVIALIISKVQKSNAEKYDGSKR